MTKQEARDRDTQRIYALEREMERRGIGRNLPPSVYAQIDAKRRALWAEHDRIYNP